MEKVVTKSWAKQNEQKTVADVEKALKHWSHDFDKQEKRSVGKLNGVAGLVDTSMAKAIESHNSSLKVGTPVGAKITAEDVRKAVIEGVGRSSLNILSLDELKEGKISLDKFGEKQKTHH